MNLINTFSLETWILFIIILVLIRFYIHRKWQILKKLNIPHDPPSTLGLMRNYFKNPNHAFSQDLVQKKKFGMVYGSYMGWHPRICISDPQILKKIFIKDFAAFQNRKNIFNKINGSEMNVALTAASGNQWKRIRNTVSPSFSTSKLKASMGLIEQCTDEMIERLIKISQENNGRFKSKEVFRKLSVNLNCSVGFGVNLSSEDGDELIKRIKQFFDCSPFRNSFLVVLFSLFPWSEQVAEKFSYSVFSNDLMTYFKKLIGAIMISQENFKTRVNIMQQMLRNEISEKDVKDEAAKNGITRNEIIANSIMILVGHETTANTLVFLSYCLATSKEVQAKLTKEINDTVEQYGGLTYEGINSMKFLEMCVKESQRLYGVVPRNSRCSNQEITVNGIQIPAGTHIDVPLYGMSHDEEYLDEPWEYKPERFADMSKIDPIIFQPFGAGPRNCIGQRFAIIEVKMAICKLIQHFYLDVCDDTPEPPLQVTYKQGSLQPKENLYLKVLRK